MGGNTIQYLVYAAAMCILCGMINYLSTRDNSVNDAGQTDLNYVVKPPAMLKQVFLVMFAFGLLLFAVFFVLKLEENPTVSVGHLRFALAFAAIGFVAFIWASVWRITVNGEQLEVRRLLRKTKTLEFSQIEKVEVTQKIQLVLYNEKGKKIAVVDALSDNYSRFHSSLEERGKLQ